MDLTAEELLSMMGDSMDEEDLEPESYDRAGPSSSYAHQLEFTYAPAAASISLNPACPGFDRQAGDMWIYPTNYPVREYQLAIVEKALFLNTLVSLPTGLGKTFIAAVVMYNFYR